MDESQWSPEPVKVYDNTYHLGPKEGERFAPSSVQDWTKDVLKSELEEKAYEAEAVSSWAMELTEKIKAQVKEKTSDRYKLAVQVHIGAMEGQGIFSASRCLWDEKTDNYVSASYYNNSLFAVATVFACYYE